MATVQKKAAARKDAPKDAAAPAKPVAQKDELLQRMVLTGPDIVAIGEEAELLVGGKELQHRHHQSGGVHPRPPVPRHLLHRLP
jgi:phosphoenolpyruvate synthase (EC 2.7.9.2)